MNRDRLSEAYDRRRGASPFRALLDAHSVRLLARVAALNEDCLSVVDTEAAIDVARHYAWQHKA